MITGGALVLALSTCFATFHPGHRCETIPFQGISEECSRSLLEHLTGVLADTTLSDTAPAEFARVINDRIRIGVGLQYSDPEYLARRRTDPETGTSFLLLWTVDALGAISGPGDDPDGAIDGRRAVGFESEGYRLEMIEGASLVGGLAESASGAREVAILLVPVPDELAAAESGFRLSLRGSGRSGLAGLIWFHKAGRAVRRQWVMESGAEHAERLDLSRPR